MLNLKPLSELKGFKYFISMDIVFSKNFVRK